MISVMCAAYMIALLIFIPLVAVDALGHSLPSRFPRCKLADLNTHRCGEENLITALHLLRDGVPELGVPSIDPLEITAIEVGESGGPVSLGIKFTNVVIKGFSNATYKDAKFNLEDKTNMSIIFHGLCDKVTFESDYEMNGRMLLVPITGKGRCLLSYEKTNASLGPGGKMMTVKGKEYFNVTDFIVDIHSIGNIDFKFDNLFNGEKDLESPTLKLINDNWKAVWEELLPVFIDVFGSLYVEYSKRIFGRVPFNDIFVN